MTLYHDIHISRAPKRAAAEPGFLARVLARFGYVKATPGPFRASRDRSHGIAVGFDYVAPHLIEDRRIYVVEGKTRPLFALVTKIAAPAMSITSVGSLESAERAIESFSYEKALLVLDIDTLGSTTDAVEKLIAFRRRSPDTPVVIGSSLFARHDFSLARGVIADASVRLPCDCVSVALAIESAVGNSAMRFRAA
ncbi:hypothetical protein [Roseinatronobacter alkalisoli]|uniref:Response regulatory domain-containing protein n=1 Tax=Roseinatronobacter alkalisoli TaxID=3028235 RepID=A0ABT5T5D6_9RHOB|nr:hypothetical protein [Roseinatronobacter sp. HJB301]MDD7970269.1 hypothetical protein [Roseinatronobacter sp. HJB301]